MSYIARLSSHLGEHDVLVVLVPAPTIPTEPPCVHAPLVVDADTVVGAARDLYDVFTGDVPTDEEGG